MNTLAPDTSVTLTVPLGETVTLQGTGTVTLLPAGTVIPVSGATVLGPYGTLQNMIVAAGSVRTVTVFPNTTITVQDGSEPLSYEVSGAGGGGGGVPLTPQQLAAGAVGVVASNNAGAMIEPDGDPVSPGGGGGVTNLSATASPTGVTVASDTGTDAALPLADGTNAGLMAPAQHTKLGALPDATTLSSALAGKASTSHSHALADVTGLVGGLNSKLTRAQVGTVGASAVVRGLADALLTQIPLTITVTPATGCTLLVESSTDNGNTYTTVGSASAFAQWEYDLSPADTGWVTHLRVSRTAGTATTSTFSIRG